MMTFSQVPSDATAMTGPPPSFGRPSPGQLSAYAMQETAEEGEETPVGSDVVDLRNLSPADMYQLSPVPGASMQPLGLTPLPRVE